MPPRYWFYLLKTLRLADLNKSTAIPGLNREDAYSQEVWVAPLREQKRIADKLDKVLARVDAARERLDRIPEIIKRFRQSVLAAATSGRLTEEWRRDNGRLEEEQVYINDRYAIPDIWAVSRMEELSEFITSGSRGWADYYADSGAIFIRAQNINSDRLILDDVAFVSLPEKAEGKRSIVAQMLESLPALASIFARPMSVSTLR